LSQALILQVFHAGGDGINIVLGAQVAALTGTVFARTSKECWVSDKTLDNASAIDRNGTSPVIEARQCSVPA
jgi:hypothetical protein